MGPFRSHWRRWRCTSRFTRPSWSAHSRFNSAGVILLVLVTLEECQVLIIFPLTMATPSTKGTSVR